MTIPNLTLITLLQSRTAVANLSTVAANIIFNTATSNTVHKINTLLITNITGGNTVDVTVSLERGGYSYRLANTISISPKTTLVAIGKDAPVYLEEGDGLIISASSNNSAEAVVSYDIIG